MRLALALLALLVLWALPVAAAAGPGLLQVQCIAPEAGCVHGVAVPRPTGVTVAPDGRTVYVRSGVGSLGSLGVFARGTAPGAVGRLREIQCVARRARHCTDGRGLETPSALAVSRDGRSAYVTAANGRSVGIYRRIVDGTLAAAGSVAGVAHPRSVAVSPDGRNVYVGGDRLSVFARSASGALRLVASTPGQAAALVVTPDGRFVYGAGGGGAHGFLWTWNRNAATGTLTAVGPPRCGVASDLPGCATGLGLLQPAALAFTPASSLLWIVSTVSGAVTQYRVDPATGAPGAVVARRGGFPLATGLALAGGRAYVAFRDGLAVLDTSLRPLGTEKLAGAAGVAAAGRSVYAVSRARITVFSTT